MSDPLNFQPVPPNAPITGGGTTDTGAPVPPAPQPEAAITRFAFPKDEPVPSQLGGLAREIEILTKGFVPPSVTPPPPLVAQTTTADIPPAPVEPLAPSAPQEEAGESIYYTRAKKMADSGAKLTPLRTFKADIADAIKDKNMSLARIVIREDDRRHTEAAQISKVSRTNIIFGVLAALLVIGGGGILGYTVLFATDEEVFINDSAARAIITAESTHAIDVTGLESDAIKKFLGEKRVELASTEGDIINTPLYQYVFDTEGARIVQPLSIRDIILRTEVKAPERFSRLIENDYMLGTYFSSETGHFLVLKTDFYQGVFAEMLLWERTLAHDVLPLLSTTRYQGDIPEKWTDKVIRNVDTRILTDRNGDIQMIWSFLGTSDTLIFATNEDTFIEALMRFKTPRPVER